MLGGVLLCLRNVSPGGYIHSKVYHSGVSRFSSATTEKSEILHPQFRSVSYPIHNSKITHPLDPTKHKNLKNSLNKLRMNHEQDWVKDTLKIVFSAFKFFKIKFLSSVGNE